MATPYSEKHTPLFLGPETRVMLVYLSNNKFTSLENQLHPLSRPEYPLPLPKFPYILLNPTQKPSEISEKSQAVSQHYKIHIFHIHFDLHPKIKLDLLTLCLNILKMFISSKLKSHNVF